MSYRFMRVLVFFDLPSVEVSDKRAYVKFRKHLIKNGFMMLQESVYTKLALTQTVADSIIKSLRANSPPDGIVLMLTITEKQFSKMEYIVGKKKSATIDSDERLIVL